MKPEEKIEEARQILIDENKKKQDLFIKEYELLCAKHGLQLQPIAGINIVEIKK